MVYIIISRSSSIMDYLPSSCLEPGAMVVRPHLMDMVKQLGIKLTDAEALKLWNR